jgi:hypothetical protein
MVPHRVSPGTRKAELSRGAGIATPIIMGAGIAAGLYRPRAHCDVARRYLLASGDAVFSEGSGGAGRRWTAIFAVPVLLW